MSRFTHYEPKHLKAPVASQVVADQLNLAFAHAWQGYTKSNPNTSYNASYRPVLEALTELFTLLEVPFEPVRLPAPSSPSPPAP